MDSIIVLLKETPIPTILVVSGVVFLFLALAGQIAGKLEVPPARQKWAAAAGTVFLGAGLLLYLAPGLPRVTHAEGSISPTGSGASSLPVAETQPVALAGQTQGEQAKGAQDPQALHGDFASPTRSGAANSIAPDDLEACFKDIFSGIAADRVVRVESGKSGKELLGAQQTKKDPAGIILLELGQPVLALTYIFVEDDELFKIGSVVDGVCQPVEYVNAARGGDRNVLQNNDWLEVTSPAGVYTLRFGYYGGVVSLDTSKFQE